MVNSGLISVIKKTIYIVVLIVGSVYVFVLFAKRSPGHVGFNGDPRITFEAMIEGKAYKPFVYRTLLPSSLRAVSAITPDLAKRECATIVEDSALLRDNFSVFGWHTDHAFQYILATLLMVGCFAGFAHYGARLTLEVCALPDTVLARSIIGIVLLMGLPWFFMYTSQLYDPPQLFLFTMSLYFLAKSKLLPFLLSFAAGCINKETTVVLVPMFGLLVKNEYPKPKYITVLLAMSIWFIIVKSFLTYAFGRNPGAFFEFHLLSHDFSILDNIYFLRSVMPLALILLALSLYRWKELPRFYRVSFASTAPILLSFSLFFGNLDEWRDFYEVYPIAFGIILYSLLYRTPLKGPKNRAFDPAVTSVEAAGLSAKEVNSARARTAI